MNRNCQQATACSLRAGAADPVERWKPAMVRRSLAAALLVWLTLGTAGASGASSASRGRLRPCTRFSASLTGPQSQLIGIAILPFQDESGMNLAPGLGLKLANDLRQKLIIDYKDVLPRMLGVGGDPSATAAMTVEQLASLGKQNGAKFVIRGGLAAATSEQIGDETRVSVQLYAIVSSVEGAADVNLRAEGSSAQKGAAVELSSVDPGSLVFRNSALGRALTPAIAQLAGLIHDTITSSPQPAVSAESTVTAQNNVAPSTDAAAAQDAAGDQELQQLIAQGQATLAANPGSSIQNINALQQALEALKAALATKASLLQESKDTAAADQDIVARKQDLQAALASLTSEASAANASAAGNGSTAVDSLGQAQQQPTGQKRDLLARVGEFADEAMGLLQKILELRSTLRSVHEDQSSVTAPLPQDPANSQTAAAQNIPPVQTTSGEVTGVVASDGNPVAGAVVSNQETGESTTTDSNGNFDLKGLIAGSLSQVSVSKNGQLIGKGHVDLPAGRAAIADFQTRSPLAGRTPPIALPGILSSTVVSNPGAHPGAGTGNLKGEVKDSAGRPASFALVQIPGVGMARANAQGQYAFINVPAGTYQVTVREGSMTPKSSPAVIAPGASVALRTQFAPADAIISSSHTLFLAGAATVLRGTVLDDQTRPVAGARVSVIQSQATVTVLTTAGGVYELRNLKPGSYKVSVYKVGYQVLSQPVVVTAAAPEQRNFHLSPVASPSVNSLIRSAAAALGEIRGTVRSQSGEPIADASIEVRPAGRALLLASAFTNSKGEYALKLAEGNYDLRASQQSSRIGDRTVAIRAGGATRADFELQRPGSSAAGGVTARLTDTRKGEVAPATNGRVAGRVIDARTGAPIASVTVSIPGHNTITTAADGGYSFANLAPGTYQVTARKSGFIDAQKTVTVHGPDTVAANFALSSAPVRALHTPAKP
jgi:hypothetical protein